MIFKCLKRKRARIISPPNNGFAYINNLVMSMNNLAKSNKVNAGELIQQHLALITRVSREVERALLRAEDMRFLMSSLFLHQSFEYLNRQEEESLHLVTGPESGKLNILSTIIPLTLKVQTIAEADAEPEELRITFLRMEKLKYHLLGYFHIHPGRGADGTYPSGTDLKLQDRLEQGGYKAVGAIFSRDGFFRFHAPRIPEIELFGEGVERINETLCHLSEIR